jgi:hypothetical protein
MASGGSPYHAFDLTAYDIAAVQFQYSTHNAQVNKWEAVRNAKDISDPQKRQKRLNELYRDLDNLAHQIFD